MSKRRRNGQRYAVLIRECGVCTAGIFFQKGLDRVTRQRVTCRGGGGGGRRESTRPLQPMTCGSSTITTQGLGPQAHRNLARRLPEKGRRAEAALFDRQTLEAIESYNVVSPPLRTIARGGGGKRDENPTIAAAPLVVHGNTQDIFFFHFYFFPVDARRNL